MCVGRGVDGEGPDSESASKRLGVIENTNQRCKRMQHPVCSQRRSSPPSTHLSIRPKRSTQSTFAP